MHASFGDVELAQMTLRAAIEEGLDLEQAFQDPEYPGDTRDPGRSAAAPPRESSFKYAFWTNDCSLMPAEIVTSQQILIQLKRFNQQVIKAQQMAVLKQQVGKDNPSQGA